MKRLLAVSWEMPPMYGPRGTQVTRTLEALTEFGWRSTVVCLQPRRGGPHWRDGADATIPDGVHLVRVASPEEWTILRAARRLFPSFYSTPDAHAVWIDRATAAALSQLSSKRFDAMVTFAQPWSNHIVGLTVRRSRDVPWVAHFSDPWIDSPYWTGAPAQREAAAKMEAQVVGTANGVVFVTDEAARLVMRKYPAEWCRKVAVVPHGFKTGARPSMSRHTGPVRFVYTGRFYDGLRTPDTLLRALSRLNAGQHLEGRIEIMFVGPFVSGFSQTAAALGLGEVVRFRDRVSPAESQSIAAGADVLLVIDAPTRGPSPFLPSKLVDYLSLRKPILGITPSEGASATLLRRLGCVAVAPDDEEGISGAVMELLRAAEAGTQVPVQFDAVAEEYDIMRTTVAFNDVLTRVCGVQAG
jgi:hypothetical protein